jgi:hypothetical protein
MHAASAASFPRTIFNEGRMKTNLHFGAILLCGISVSLTLGAKNTAAQGPAGAGASGAAQDISLNPIKWVKKEPKNSEAPVNRTDAEKKLTPILQGQGVLPASLTSTEACSPFT